MASSAVLSLPDHSATGESFDPASVAALPAAARRWLTHAIEPGTPLAVAAELETHGAIRLGHWRPFTAREVLVPASAFLWSARTKVAGLPVHGLDCYARGHGLMSWYAPWAIEVRSGREFDVALSAAHRLAAESVLVPTALVHATWREGPTPDAATFEHRLADLHGSTHVTIRVAAGGRLAGLSMHRWGSPDGTHTYKSRRFEIEFDDEQEIDGLRSPSGFHAAWFDEDGRRADFFRAHVDSVSYLRAAPAL